MSAERHVVSVSMLAASNSQHGSMWSTFELTAIRPSKPVWSIRGLLSLDPVCAPYIYNQLCIKPQQSVSLTRVPGFLWGGSQRIVDQGFENETKKLRDFPEFLGSGGLVGICWHVSL